MSNSPRAFKRGQKPDAGQIEKIIYEALQVLRGRFKQLPQLEESPDTRLFGQGGALDSLSLVNLVVMLEDNLQTEFGCPISLANEEALSQEVSPFTTVQTLIDYIEKIWPQGSP